MIPPGETTEEHRVLQQEEASLVDKDKATGASTGKSLFGARFQDSGPRNIPVIRDVEDGIDRCPRCTWELEDGWCESCGYGVAYGYSEPSMSDSDRSYYTNDLGDEPADHHIMGDDSNLYAADDFLEERSVSMDERAVSADSDEDFRNYEGRDTHAYQPFARARQRVRNPTAAAQNSGYSHRRDSHEVSSTVDHDEDDESYPDTELYSSDGTAGSLNDFIADDSGERVPLAGSPRSSLYSIENGTEEALSSSPDYEGGFSPYESNHEGHAEGEESTGSVQNNSDGDSQSSSMVQPYLVEAPLVESDEDAEILAMVQARRNGRHLNSKSNISQSLRQEVRVPQYRGSTYTGRSEQAPIEIGSDSDIPMPVPTSRRHRLIVDPESSGDDATTRHSHESASSGTVRRRSPGVSSPGISTAQNNGDVRQRPSPMILNSSPIRGSSSEGSRTTRSPALGYPPRPRQIAGATSIHANTASSSSVGTPWFPRTLSRRISSEARHSPSTASSSPREPNSHSREKSSRRFPNTRQSPSNVRFSRLLTPRVASNHAAPSRPSPIRNRSSRVASSPASGHGHRSTASLRSSESDEVRAAAKAERRRMKLDTRRRHRGMANTSAAGLASTQSILR